jgi:hypothetical protein
MLKVKPAIHKNALAKKHFWEKTSFTDEACLQTIFGQIAIKHVSMKPLWGNCHANWLQFTASLSLSFSLYPSSLFVSLYLTTLSLSLTLSLPLSPSLSLSLCLRRM